MNDSRALAAPAPTLIVKLLLAAFAVSEPENVWVDRGGRGGLDDGGRSRGRGRRAARVRRRDRDAQGGADVVRGRGVGRARRPCDRRAAGAGRVAAAPLVGVGRRRSRPGAVGGGQARAGAVPSRRSPAGRCSRVPLTVAVAVAGRRWRRRRRSAHRRRQRRRGRRALRVAERHDELHREAAVGRLHRVLRRRPDDGAGAPVGVAALPAHARQRQRRRAGPAALAAHEHLADRRARPSAAPCRSRRWAARICGATTLTGSAGRLRVGEAERRAMPPSRRPCRT